jgi:hypothetical protein
MKGRPPCSSRRQRRPWCQRRLCGGQLAPWWRRRRGRVWVRVEYPEGTRPCDSFGQNRADLEPYPSEAQVAVRFRGGGSIVRVRCRSEQAWPPGSGRASLIFRVVQQGLGRARRCPSRGVVGGDGRGLVSLVGVPAAQMMRPGARAARSESELKGEVRRVLAGATAAVVMAVTGPGVSPERRVCRVWRCQPGAGRWVIRPGRG